MDIILFWNVWIPVYLSFSFQLFLDGSVVYINNNNNNGNFCSALPIEEINNPFHTHNAHVYIYMCTKQYCVPMTMDTRSIKTSSST